MPADYSDWRLRSETIQRDPLRISGVALDVQTEIAEQNAGRSETIVAGESLEAEVVWQSHNMKVTRHDLVRACAALMMSIALWDIGTETDPVQWPPMVAPYKAPTT